MVDVLAWGCNPLCPVAGLPDQRGGNQWLPPLALFERIMMGIVDDYISGLEGKENPVLTEVVSDLLRLHNEEMGTREAKIETLNTSLAEKDSVIAEKDSEIGKWKTMNFDLSMQIPSNPSSEEQERTEVDGSNITPDDLFNSEG